jgi:hypothetical protein
MKKAFTLICGLLLFFGTLELQAQSLQEQADKQTREMAAKLKLNATDIGKVRQFNLTRLEKIAALNKLREKDNRYLDLRLDKIEEEYSSALFNTLNRKQFVAFMDYKKDKPYTYAGLTMKTLNTIALQNPE